MRVEKSVASTYHHPSFKPVLLQQALELAIRYRWDLIVIFMATFWFPILIKPFKNYSVGTPIVDGAIGFPFIFIFMLLASFWALRVWDDFPPDSRDDFLTLPVEKHAHLLFRVGAGGLLLLAVICGAWMVGAVVAELVEEQASAIAYYSLITKGSGIGWLVTVIGLLNVYLYTTVVSLLSKRPEQWVLIWIPAGVFFLYTVLRLFELDFPSDVLAGVITAVLAGFGFASAAHRDVVVWPSITAVLLGLMIWCASVRIAAGNKRSS